MEFRTSVLLVALIATPAIAHAEVCLSDSGLVVPCPSLLPHPVTARFEIGTLPRVAGSPSEIYITAAARWMERVISRSMPMVSSCAVPMTITTVATPRPSAIAPRPSQHPGPM